jgi:hypothetical protein
MNEHPAFSDQWMTLSSREEALTLDEFVSEAATFVAGYVSQTADLDRGLPPIAVIEHGGEVRVISWGNASPEYSEHFLDRMVPETLGSYEASIAALVTHATMSTRASSDPTVSEPRDVVLLSVLAITGDTAQELALAGGIERGADGSLELELLAPVQEGLAPAVADALYEGLGLTRRVE